MKRGKHRASWLTPWQSLLGQVAYECGIRGVRHRLTPLVSKYGQLPPPAPQLTVAGLARAATGDLKEGTTI